MARPSEKLWREGAETGSDDESQSRRRKLPLLGVALRRKRDSKATRPEQTDAESDYKDYQKQDGISCTRLPLDSLPERRFDRLFNVRNDVETKGKGECQAEVAVKNERTQGDSFCSRPIGKPR